MGVRSAPRKQVLLLAELITFSCVNVHTVDSKKWKCPHLLHDMTVGAEFFDIGEMQKPNFDLLTKHDKNDNQEFKLEHDVELYVDSKLGQQDQEFKADHLTPRMSAIGA